MKSGKELFFPTFANVLFQSAILRLLDGTDYGLFEQKKKEKTENKIKDFVV